MATTREIFESARNGAKILRGRQSNSNKMKIEQVKWINCEKHETITPVKGFCPKCKLT